MTEQDLNIKANLYVKKFWYEQDIKTKRLLKIAYKCGYPTGEEESFSEILADVRQLNLPPVSNSLPDFRDVIEARIKFFNANYHTYEGSKLQNALNTIRRLVPPILFQIGQ